MTMRMMKTMTIADMKKLFPEVREYGKYVYAYSVFNECVELYTRKKQTDVLFYAGDFDNMTDCENYCKRMYAIYGDDLKR